MSSPRNRSRAEKKPTCVILVLGEMTRLDDFTNVVQLRAATGLSGNQITASLSHLKKSKVVDCLEGPDGLWWFLTGEDKRSYALELRTPEDKPRARGKRVVKGEQK